MSTRYQDLMDKALQCIHLARAVNDRYPDPTKMGAEEVGQRKSLLTEAARLRELAQAEKAQTDMEAWAAQPDSDGQVLPAMAAAGEAKAVKTGGADPMGEANSRLAMQRFAKAVRYGKGALTLEEKAALVENATGEVIVPQDFAGPIFKTLPHLAVFRSIGPLIRNTTSDRVDVRALTQATAGWGKVEVNAAAPTDANVVPSTPTLTVAVQDLMAMSQIGVDELQDTDANLVALVQDIIGQQIAQQEDDAFANGPGTSQPWGLAMRATQASPVITQAVTAAANATPTGDNLKALQYAVPSRFQTNGAYAASRDAAQAIALLKDTTSNYLWQPSVRAGEPDTLFGKRFYVLEGLPSMGASAAAVDSSVIFGDFNQGYMIAQRQTITMQRLDERYAELGLVGFIFKLRVGGDVIRPSAFAKYLL